MRNEIRDLKEEEVSRMRNDVLKRILTLVHNLDGKGKRTFSQAAKEMNISEKEVKETYKEGKKKILASRKRKAGKKKSVRKEKPKALKAGTSKRAKGLKKETPKNIRLAISDEEGPIFELTFRRGRLNDVIKTLSKIKSSW